MSGQTQLIFSMFLNISLTRFTPKGFLFNNLKVCDDVPSGRVPPASHQPVPPASMARFPLPASQPAKLKILSLKILAKDSEPKFLS